MWRRSPGVRRSAPVRRRPPPRAPTRRSASTSSAWIIGPMSVSASSGSPTLSVASFATSCSANVSKTRAWTYTRCTAMQLCPAKANPPTATRATANSRSADASTITPALPPSSRMIFFRPARFFMSQPTADEPVKVSSLNRSSVTRRSPVVARHRQHADRLRGQSGADHDLGERDRGERGLGRRFEDDRIAGGDRRRDLVGGEVQRKVERRDRGHRADRHAADDRRAVRRRAPRGPSGRIRRRGAAPLRPRPERS